MRLLTGFRGGDEGLQTFEFRCTSVPAAIWKRNEDDLARSICA